MKGVREHHTCDKDEGGHNESTHPVRPYGKCEWEGEGHCSAPL
jgi:hypothetical protein